MFYIKNNIRASHKGGVMRKLSTILALAAVCTAIQSAQANEPVPIGMVTTLSSAGGYLGEETRDGFQLAIEEGEGKLGGVAVKLTVEDDALKPSNGREIVNRLIKRDGVKIFTGVVFSNVLIAVAPEILDSGAFYIGSVAGPSNYAGKACHKNYFIASFQNDSIAEAAGEQANSLGYKNMVAVAVNYQAGKDALEGFKRFYKGTVSNELFTRLDQTDFAAEIAQIRAAKPDAVFAFLPGGFGINFMRQYSQAGLKDKIPLVVPHASMEQRMIKALGDVSVGIYNSSYWSPDIDNPTSKAFVRAFEKRYGRTPTFYAATAYDTARLIGTALKAVGGDMTKSEEFRAALAKADFASVRGSFKFGKNQHPVQDWLALRVQRNGDAIENKIVGRIFAAHTDAFVGECKM